jgi:uncharacterized membrane protein HdeD (DUF308 family)
MDSAPPSQPPPELSTARQRAAGLRNLTLFEGVLTLVLGILALLFPTIASKWVTAMVAVAFLVGGIMGWLNNLMRSALLGRWLTFWRLVISSLFLLAGGTMISQLGSGSPVAGAPVATLALAIGVVFVLEGLVCLGVSLSHRRIRGWAWGLMNGLVTLALGLLILSMGPAALLNVIGLLVGVSFLFSAVDLFSFSASFHDT